MKGKKREEKGKRKMSGNNTVKKKEKGTKNMKGKKNVTNIEM